MLQDRSPLTFDIMQLSLSVVVWVWSQPLCNIQPALSSGSVLTPQLIRQCRSTRLAALALAALTQLCHPSTAVQKSIPICPPGPPALKTHTHYPMRHHYAAPHCDLCCAALVPHSSDQCCRQGDTGQVQGDVCCEGHATRWVGG